ncbi:MAG TPA: hypothetical protein VJ623_10120 [Holophagaceae bacterium]|nr:hypothetical protein [Holophagaceae bacterium]
MTTLPPPPRKSSIRLGEYRLTAGLSEDPFGTLHRAVRVEGGAFGRHALIRRFHPRWLAAGLGTALAESVPQSLRLGEARGLAAHCRIYHQATEPWISYDLDPGLTLAELLNRCRAQGMVLGLEHALTVLRDLAGVLEHLHLRDVPHGLLVPDLVWITTEGSVLLLDAPVAPQLRRVMGAAPVPGLEVLAQAPPSGAARDLHLLACLGWQLLTLEPEVPPRAEVLVASLEAWATTAEGGFPAALRGLFARMVGLEEGFADFAAFQVESGVALRLEDHAPSTFNLAFLVHTLLRDRIAVESRELEAERAATWTVSAAVPVLTGGEPPAAPARSWRALGMAGGLLLAGAAGLLFTQRSGSHEAEGLRRALAEAQRQQAERDQARADVEASLLRESERRARLQAQVTEARDAAKVEALEQELKAARMRQAELLARQARARAEAEEAAALARRLQTRAAGGPAPVPSPLPQPAAPPLGEAPARLLQQAPWKGAPVRLRVFVGEGGRALRALAAEGAGTAEAEALEAALRSTYQPAFAGGKATRSWVEVELSAR